MGKVIRHWLYISLKQVSIDAFDIFIFRTRLQNGDENISLKGDWLLCGEIMFLTSRCLIMDRSVLITFIILLYYYIACLHPQLIHQRLWCMLSSLWQGAYKICTLLLIGKSSLCGDSRILLKKYVQWPIAENQCALQVSLN